jgi:hypothetical protein
VWGSRRFAGALAVLALLGSSACSEAIRTGQSPGYLVITSLQGAPGLAGSFGATLQSDVLNFDPDTGRASIAPDRGQVVLQLNMKDPTLSPSPANAITLTQYRVEYVRADGRNTQGVDVPYAFRARWRAAGHPSGGRRRRQRARCHR